MTEAELAEIEARHAHDGGMVQWAPTVDVRTLLAEVRRLQPFAGAAGKMQVGLLPDRDVLEVRQWITRDLLIEARDPNEVFAYAVDECARKFREYIANERESGAERAARVFQDALKANA